MPSAQRTRSSGRRGRSRDAAPRYVAPVLDPGWQNPYAPSAAERHAHQAALRHFALRRQVPFIVLTAVLVVGGVVAGVLVQPWLIALALVVGVLLGSLIARSVSRAEHQGRQLGPTLAGRFGAGGDAHAEARLRTLVDRLSATFGLDEVRVRIVADRGLNAALVPDADGLTLILTEGAMAGFELIELEGVVAHLMARQRLGLLARESLACVAGGSQEARRELAGPGQTFRADEVAASTIRYPLGIAGALRRCATTPAPAGSYFASPAYTQERWIWFDVAAERVEPVLGDLDDPTLRAMALEEW